MKNYRTLFLGASAFLASAAFYSPAKADSLKELAAAFVENLGSVSNYISWSDIPLTNIKKSAAYDGIAYPACPTIHAYNSFVGPFVYTAVQLNSTPDICKRCRDLLNKSLDGVGDKDISLFVVAQDMYFALNDSFTNTVAPSLKPQHWLMEEADSKTFNKNLTYPFDCAVGLFNTNIYENLVSSPSKQITIGGIANANGLSAHKGGNPVTSILSGNVLNFQISKQERICAFFSVVRTLPGKEAQSKRRGAAVTLHILIDTSNSAIASTTDKARIIDILLKAVRS